MTIWYMLGTMPAIGDRINNNVSPLSSKILLGLTETTAIHFDFL